MIGYFIMAASLLILVFAIFKLYIQPKKLIDFYQKIIGSNFKVYTYRFIPLQAT